VATPPRTTCGCGATTSRRGLSGKVVRAGHGLRFLRDGDREDRDRGGEGGTREIA
jgi:hypothetical protein